MGDCRAGADGVRFTIGGLADSRGYFVTGTDTGVGKTYVTCLLVRAARSAGSRCCGYKPVSCGDRTDAEALLGASGEPTLRLDEVNPLWFQAPLAPLAAARLERRRVDPAELVAGLRRLASRFSPVLVEGAGGWEVPLAPGFSMADLAVALELPVVVVVANRLGALNHTALTVGAVRARGLTVAGLVLNHPNSSPDPASTTNRSLLEEVCRDVPVLAEITHAQAEVRWPEGLATPAS